MLARARSAPLRMYAPLPPNRKPIASTLQIISSVNSPSHTSSAMRSPLPMSESSKPGLLTPMPSVTQLARMVVRKNHSNILLVTT